MKKKYSLTLICSFIGYIVQAIVCNLTPLLYAQFSSEFGVSTNQISILILCLFLSQIIIDLVVDRFAAKLGSRICTLMANSTAGIGLVLLSFLPYIMDPFLGIIISTIFMCIGGGFIEVICSPALEALPIKNKTGMMSILHSFYSWGTILVVLLSTFFFSSAGITLWRYLPLCFAVIPFINLIFGAICPFEKLEGDKERQTFKEVFKPKLFIVFLFLMFASGASEIIIGQWASYFIEIGLNVNKTMGDLLGTCLFAVGMAISRTLYGFFGDKVNLKVSMLISGVLLTGSYVLVGLSHNPYLSLLGIALIGLFVGIMWPATYSLAGRTFKLGGTKMFGLLALMGDLGAAIAPFLISFISDDIQTSILISTIYPCIFVVGIIVCLLNKKSKNE